jgi:fimbrial chaperone protein
MAARSQAQMISPVVVDISRNRPVVSVTVTNSSDDPMRLQTDTLAWTQVDGEDHFEESDDLIVVPPIAEIRPRSTQIFRVTLRHRSFTPDERAYRVVLEDIEVRAPSPDSVVFHLAHRLPVFVAGLQPGVPQPTLSRCPPPNAGTCVRIANDGSHYLQFKSLTVSSTGWTQVVASGGRILAHGWRQFLIVPPRGASGTLQCAAVTSAGLLTAELTLP